MADKETKIPSGGMKRRDMLKAMTAVPAAALIPLAPAAASAARAKTPAAPGSLSGAYQPKVFNTHEWQTIRVLSDLIIPADDRSGSATDAGVPEFIDDQLDFNGGDQVAEIRGGLVWLDVECNRLFGSDFIRCSGMEQKKILDRIAYPAKAAPEDSNAAAWFSALRDMVVGGYFSSKIGVEDLPYLGNKMLSEWDGCPAEVLTAIEERFKTQKLVLTKSASESPSRT